MSNGGILSALLRHAKANRRNSLALNAVQPVLGDMNEMRGFLLAACLLLSACSDRIPEADLIGVYVASYRGDTAMLRLGADHICTHVIRLKDGQTVEGEPTWKASYVGADTHRTVVEFSNFIIIPSFSKGKKVQWATEVDRTWLGRIQLCVNSDVGYCYVKLTSS